MIDTLAKLVDYLTRLLAERRVGKDAVISDLVEHPFKLLEEVYRDLLMVTQGLLIHIERHKFGPETRDWLRKARIEKKTARDNLVAISELKVTQEAGFPPEVVEFYQSLIGFFHDRIYGWSEPLQLMRVIDAASAAHILTVDLSRIFLASSASEALSSRNLPSEGRNPIEMHFETMDVLDETIENLESDYKDLLDKYKEAFVFDEKRHHGVIALLYYPRPSLREVLYLKNKEQAQVLQTIIQERAQRPSSDRSCIQQEGIFNRTIAFSALSEVEKMFVLTERAKSLEDIDHWVDRVREWIVTTEERISIRFGRVAGAYYRVKLSRHSGIFR